MTKLNINLGSRSYPIYITTDFSLLGNKIADKIHGNKVVIVTDTNVDRYYGSQCQDLLESSGYKTYRYVIQAGEKSKNLDTVRDIYNYLMKSKIERNSALIALGGGVTGDIAGFAAATYLRGINYVQVPTSLLAQVDSSVGGKTGVDLEGGKNLIGAFYQPSMVFINVNSLRTLPRREVKTGMAEIIKHGIIASENFYEYVDRNIDNIYAINEEVLVHTVKTNCSIKGDIVEKDEKENGLRAILNFGHTIGHAIETASKFSLTHGESVSIGMAGAFEIAVRNGMISADIRQRVCDTLLSAGLPLKYRGISPEEIYNHMLYDKKVVNNSIVFILPEALGKVRKVQINDKQLIMEILEIISC